MSRWWRAHDEAVDDPKLQRLSGDLFKAWFNLCCLTSQNGGILPPTDVIAFKLRVKLAKADLMVKELRSRKLIDEMPGTGLTMHNWNARQYKSDVSTERVKRFRDRPRNVSSNVSETPPETETESEKNAATAAPSDLEKQLFDRGKQICGQTAGGLIAKLLKAKKGDVALARSAVELAATKQNPREFIGAIITGGHASTDGKRLTNDEQFWGEGRIPGII